MKTVRTANQMQQVAGSILTVLVFCFWFFIYRYHLLYQEMSSIFLNSPDFFGQFAWKPGGWSEYAGAFIIQFFQYPVFGAILQTLAFVAVFYFTNQIMTRHQLFKQWFALAWLPAFMLLGLQMNYSFLFTDTLKVVSCFGLCYTYTLLPSPRARWISLIPGAFLVFLLCGAGISVYFCLFVITFEYCVTRERVSYPGLVLFAAIILLIPQIWRYFYLINQKQLYSLFPAADEINIQGLQIFIFIWLPLLVTAHKITSRIRMHIKTNSCFLLNLFILCLSIWFLKTSGYHPNTELQLHLEYATMQRNWDEILDIVKKHPNPPASATPIINLALAGKGKLNEKLFDYPQTGLNGLIPNTTSNNYFAYLHGYQIYTLLEQDNEAFRHLFEASVCKSAQTPPLIYKGLTELLIKMNKYEASRKYLSLLLSTKDYSNWAKATLSELSDKQTIPLQKTCPGEDHILGVNPIGDLIYMASQAPHNRTVRDYLLTSLLLAKDLGTFYHYFSNYFAPDSFIPIPRVYEEALITITYSGLDPAASKKYTISEDTWQRFSNYRKQNGKNNYWYYYQYVTPENL